MKLNFLRFLTDGRLFLSMFMLSFAEGAAALSAGGDGAAAAVIADAAADATTDVDPDAPVLDRLHDKPERAAGFPRPDNRLDGRRCPG